MRLYTYIRNEIIHYIIKQRLVKVMERSRSDKISERLGMTIVSLASAITFYITFSALMV